MRLQRHKLDTRPAEKQIFMSANDLNKSTPKINQMYPLNFFRIRKIYVWYYTYNEQSWERYF